jgi:hypothetical protein
VLLVRAQAACAEGEADVLLVTRRVLAASGAPEVAPPLTRALEDAAAGVSEAPLGPPAALLRALSASLRLGCVTLDDQAHAHRLLHAVAMLHGAARDEPEVQTAAAACLAGVRRVACRALLRWYVAACSMPAVLACATLALAGDADAPLALPATADALRAVHATLAGLRPPKEVFGQESVDAKAAAAFTAAAAARFGLLPRLMALLPPTTLFPPAMRCDPECGWPPGGEGVQDGGVHPGPAAVLVAASFFCGASLDGDAPACEGLPVWSSAAAAAAAEGTLAWLHRVAAEAPLRWRDCDTLLAASLAARAPTLRLSLLVAELGAPYDPTAPSSYDADVAAQTLRAALARLGHPAATQALPAAFPCLLLALEHTAAAPRLHAQQAARHLAGTATRTSLRVRAGVLWPALLAGLLGCEERAWAPAVAAAVACAHALGGADATAAPYHTLLSTLLTELGRRPGDARRALPLLRAAPPLARAMGLELLRHTLRLLPLLLEWLASAQEEHRMLAAEALTAAMERIWPRAPDHAPMLWPALLRGFISSAGAAHAVATRAALLRLAEQLHFAGGAPFAATWRASEREGCEAASPEAAPLMERLRQLRAEQPVAADDEQEGKVLPVQEPASLVEPSPTEATEQSEPPKQAEPSSALPDAGEPANAAEHEERSVALDAPSAALAQLPAAMPEGDDGAWEHAGLDAFGFADDAALGGGFDMAALLAEDAHVTAALDAWAAGDMDILQAAAAAGGASSYDSAGALDGAPVSQLLGDADDDLDAWLASLSLEAQHERQRL